MQCNICSYLHLPGPAKSIPTLLNGAASDTLNSGSGAAGGGENAFPSSFLQIKQRVKIFFTYCLPLVTQNLDLSSDRVALNLQW